MLNPDHISCIQYNPNRLDWELEGQLQFEQPFRARVNLVDGGKQMMLLNGSAMSYLTLNKKSRLFHTFHTESCTTQVNLY